MAAAEMEYAPIARSAAAIPSSSTAGSTRSSAPTPSASRLTSITNGTRETTPATRFSAISSATSARKPAISTLSPRLANLNGAQVYVIASPDNLDKNPHPHFANAEDAAQIAEWVKAGGVLVIMENDTSFADLDHFNVISDKFGIHFNSVLRKHVIGTNWEQGRIDIDGSGPIFHHPHTIYVKDVCTITASPATAVLTEGGDIFMATAKYGKGTVFAMTDPWLYNEYTDGRKLPALYDNYAAGKEFVRWILQQVPEH